MIINISKGDLFALDNEKYTFAHCISLDAKMGAGIAVAFDKKVKGMKGYIERVVYQNNLNYPCVVPYFGSDYSVYNLITKEKYWNKPTLKTIESTIRDMAYMCKNNETKYLAMPKIGCGLDRLNWATVLNIIKEEFKDMDIEIEVKYL